MVHVPLIFLSERREFPSATCLEKKKNVMTTRVSVLLKSRASPDMIPFSLCNKKTTCNSAHEQTRLSNDTIDSVLRHWEVVRPKQLSAPFRVCVYIYIPPLFYVLRTGNVFSARFEMNLCR